VCQQTEELSVTAADVPAIGERVRAERTRQGLSARALARDVGVSASLISQIETDKSQPSVSTLYAISTALGIPIGELFGDTPAPARPEAAPAAAAAEDPAAGGAAAESASGRSLRSVVQAGRGGVRVGPVVRASERAVLTLDSGVTWQRLGQLPGSHVDFLLVTYQPGGASSGSELLMRHSGTEYGYLLGGELVLTLGFEEHRLTAGDAVCFDSTTPHRYRNDGMEPALGVWLVLEPRP
jgi:transcriptional regulator with XRE-family HTH domain/quercetin dioxygenase-like cupin family protein